MCVFFLCILCRFFFIKNEKFQFDSSIFYPFIHSLSFRFILVLCIIWTKKKVSRIFHIRTWIRFFFTLNLSLCAFFSHYFFFFVSNSIQSFQWTIFDLLSFVVGIFPSIYMFICIILVIIWIKLNRNECIFELFWIDIILHWQQCIDDVIFLHTHRKTSSCRMSIHELFICWISFSFHRITNEFQ